jgi:molybdenum cofactor cytidylyltransferase
MSKNAAMLLAAGSSTRFKADKRLFGQPPLVIRTLTTLVDIFDVLYVVIRAEDTQIQKYLTSYPIKLVYAPAAPKGLAYSIASGMKALQDDVDSVSICLADMPLIQISTYRLLLQYQREDRIVRPRYRQQPGHPVVFGQAFFQALRSLDHQSEPELGAKYLLQKESNRLSYIEVDDKHVLTDIDIQADLDLLR